MKDSRSIDLVVAEKRIPLKITAGEEEKVRGAARMLNDKIKKYRGEYGNSPIDKDKIVIGASISVISELLDELAIAGREYIENELEDIKMMLEDSILNDL